MPEAGIAFAIAIMLGVALTLSVVAILVISVRSGVAIERHGGQVDYAGGSSKSAAGRRSF